ncbi:hypothetical protein [Thiohalophilus thiocyanatoxydans]|uniref:hypothetical protein n=1 Tax=Thiohalophilus thiocyanatoxydans TaxID=381308 RepID=UPI001065167B|nr:hypothetical protein [Thiohalophilus thiocyanatoxydans]
MLLAALPEMDRQYFLPAACRSWSNQAIEFARCISLLRVLFPGYSDDDKANTKVGLVGNEGTPGIALIPGAAVAPPRKVE